MPGVGKRNCTNFELAGHASEREKTRRTRLYYSAITANLAFFSCGISLSWTSPTLPKLQSEDSWLKGVDNEVSSLIASFLMLGASVGPVVAGLILNNLGRKKTLVSSTAIHLLSWIVLGFAASAEVIYFARFLQGIAVAMVFTAVPMYVSEIAERTLRAALASSSEGFLAIGYLTVYCVGPFIPYTGLILLGSVMPLVTFLLFFCIPESPHFMLAKGNKSKAMDNLRWLRGNVSVTTAKREIAMIQASIEQGLHSSGQKSKLWELLGNRGNVKALYLSSGLMLLQQFSGINVVLFYAQGIFMKTGAKLSPSVCAMIVGGVQLFSASLTPAVVKRFGFKIPLMISSIGMCFAQGFLGLYFFFEDLNYNMESWGWLPVTSLVLYIHVYCIGFGPLPWAFLGEIFPPNIKEVASGFCTSFSFFLAFLITKFYVNISDVLGTYVAFWIFSVCCIFAFLFVLFLMPNTRGLSLPEIQDLLNGRPITRLDRIPEEAPIKNAGTNNLI